MVEGLTSSRCQPEGRTTRKYHPQLFARQRQGGLSEHSSVTSLEWERQMPAVFSMMRHNNPYPRCQGSKEGAKEQKPTATQVTYSSERSSP